MANHSCDYNCAGVFDGMKLQLRTIKDVKEGEECTISYVDVINPAKERQAKLEEEYHFTCKCVKCVEEINASGPVDDGSGELELQDCAKVLQLCGPYLKPMDSSSSIPVNHYLLVRVRHRALIAYMDLQEWEKAAEIGQLITEHYR
ncbi:histone-lysine N-methyltransferase SMYD3-like [Strongylocentrotus purpuratus]|uniref:SET domain-containing protein n=1 Tax=Strongylocentrotus purpuratus TaxID=7668 RepID=A0A7M7PMW5_STRPU|nr:histone-lysine N-methyltransferase SMYD3-like [Strongylocentrotus purpuratus]